jgi:hypothetical protein
MTTTNPTPTKTLTLIAELADIIRYFLLTAIAFLGLVAVIIPLFLFVLPDMLDTDLMTLLSIQNPDNIASVVIQRAMNIAGIIVFLYWVTYVPRMILSLSSDNKENGKDGELRS